MATQGQVEFMQQPLRVIMGRSYLKYKKVAEDMLFLNKAVRTLSKRELLSIIGYFALKYGIVEQPIPPHKPTSKEKAGNKNERENTKEERSTVGIQQTVRMDSSRLG